MNSLRAREGADIFCNRCLQRFFLILEPGFSKLEVPQPKPQLPIACPFCGENDIEQEDGTIVDAKVMSEENFRMMMRS